MEAAKLKQINIFSSLCKPYLVVALLCTSVEFQRAYGQSMLEKNANNFNVITGTVLDEKREPMIGALVKLYDCDSLVAKMSSDADGIFVFNLHKLSTLHNDVFLNISYASYYTRNIMLWSTDSLVNITVHLEINMEDLRRQTIITY